MHETTCMLLAHAGCKIICEKSWAIAIVHMSPDPF